MTPMERITAALAAAPDPKRVRRLESIARTYQPDERMEALIKLRTTDPATFAAVMDPTTRMALGSYEHAKAAYDAWSKEQS